jgi:hypothetical protein
MRAHIQNKKTEGEEDEHTYTIEKKSGVVVEHDSSLLSTFFFNLRSVTTIYIYMKEVELSTSVANKKKVRLVLFSLLSLFLPHTYFFLSFISV